MMDSVKRPPLLSRLLDFKMERETEASDMFKEFLELSDVSTRESVAANLGIAANYKLACIPYVSEFVGYNDNLLKIFSFYAKIANPNHHGGLFDFHFDMNHETMNFKKFEVFCRDYNIIPKLLMRDDLKIVWEMMANDWALNGKGAFVAMKFPDFKDMIVRLALLAYHKPGLKKLIISMEGFMPKNTEIVDCFCNFLHLHDVKYILNHIRTVGRNTQGDMNFRSRDDPNTRTVKEIQVDKEGRKRSQLKPSTPHTAVSTADATTGRPKSPHPHRLSHPDSSDHVHGASSYDKPNSAKSFREASEDIPKRGYNAFGEKIVVPFKMGYANPEKVVRSCEEPTNRKKSESLMPPSLRARLSDNMIPPSDNSNGKHVSIEVNQKNEEPPHHEHHHHHHDHNNGSSGHHHHHHHHSHRHHGGGGDSQSVGSAQSSAFSLEIDNSIEALKQSINRDYEPVLVGRLARYSYVPPRIELSDTVYLGGPFVDLGLLVTGSKVTINMSVTNGTADDLYIDCTTRNFKSSDTDLKTFGKALIPGFTRSVQITFTVEAMGKKNVLAFIDIISIAVRNGENCCISCPVFYRVDSSTTKDFLPKCTSETLQDLMGQYSLGDRRVELEFVKQKSEGVWSNKTQSSLRNLLDKSKPRTIKIYTATPGH